MQSKLSSDSSIHTCITIRNYECEYDRESCRPFNIFISDYLKAFDICCLYTSL